MRCALEVSEDGNCSTAVSRLSAAVHSLAGFPLCPKRFNTLECGEVACHERDATDLREAHGSATSNPAIVAQQATVDYDTRRQTQILNLSFKSKISWLFTRVLCKTSKACLGYLARHRSCASWELEASRP